jgi:hypothetical protein
VSWVLLEKLIISQLLCLLWNPNVHWPPSQARWNEATHFHPLCSRSILMKCPCHTQIFQLVIYFKFSYYNSLCISFFSHVLHVLPIVFLDLIALMVFSEMCKLWSSLLYIFSLLPSLPLPYAQYSPQHPVLKHSQYVMGDFAFQKCTA